MKEEEFKTLQVGDLVQSVPFGNSFVIIHKTNGPEPTFYGIQTVAIEKPENWKKLRRRKPGEVKP